jgi:GT2 family glycosyltransferase
VTTAPASPEVALVVASHDRPARLARLLDALATQTLERDRWEAVVAHDSSDDETEALLRDHALAQAGLLRHLRFAPGAGPAEKRNAAWREARAPLIAFTDDDCRPPPEWLERLLAAAEAAPGAIVQGTTRPDPEELDVARRAFSHSQSIDPPSPYAQTCNILYPRALLEQLGGFDESLPVAAGEDTDLAFRALEAGARQEAAPGALTYHAVTATTLRGELRALQRWEHLAYVVKRHPRARRHLLLGAFWKPSHLWLPLALAAPALARRNRLLALVAVPWALAAMPSYGPGPRGRARAVAELPLRAIVDAAEMLTALRGSVRYRTFFL